MRGGNILNVFQMLKDSISTIYVKYISDNKIESLPIFYIGGSQNLPPPLTPDEEEKELEKLSNGDETVRKILVEKNLRLVVYIAKKFENTGIGIEDLISIGTIGLMKAINTYDTSKKIKLATYASRCIENEILMYFRNNKKRNKDISINESIGFDKEGNEITILDILKSPKPDFAMDLHTKENIKLLDKYIKVLNEREKDIIKRRYGLFNSKEQTQKSIAKNLGISRSYVSRIEKRALIKMLREFIKNKNITELK